MPNPVEPPPMPSSPVLSYRSKGASIAPKAPGNPAAGISGVIISIGTFCLGLLAFLLAPKWAMAFSVLPVAIGFWPLGLVLSLMGLVQSGARGYAAVGLLVSLGGMAAAAWIGLRAV